jgi:hypothetical protein
MTDGPKKMVWVYVDTNLVGHPDRLKVFATPATADDWFKENDPKALFFASAGGEKIFDPATIVIST